MVSTYSEVEFYGLITEIRLLFFVMKTIEFLTAKHNRMTFFKKVNTE